MLITGDMPADAIIFANDNLACGALLAAQRAGINIPQQCAIVGFGDYAIADKLYPSLTTIRPPATEIGEVAARRILLLHCLFLLLFFTEWILLRVKDYCLIRLA